MLRRGISMIRDRRIQVELRQLAEQVSQRDTHPLRTDNPHRVTVAQVGAIPSSEKGQPNGVATLDETGKIPSTQLIDPVFLGALVRKTTTQSIPAQTFTDIIWEGVIYDTSGFWSSSSPTKLVVPAGITRVRILANVEWATSFSEEVLVQIHKNNASFPGMGMVRGTGTAGGGINIISAPINVAQSDYFTVVVYQNNLSSKSINAANATWFAIEVIE